MAKAFEIKKNDTVRYAGDLYRVENVQHGDVYTFMVIDGESVRLKANASIEIVER